MPVYIHTKHTYTLDSVQSSGGILEQDLSWEWDKYRAVWNTGVYMIIIYMICEDVSYARCCKYEVRGCYEAWLPLLNRLGLSPNASLLLTHSSSSQLHTSVYPSLTEARFFHHSIPPLPLLLKPIASPVSSQLSCFHVQYTQVKVLGFHMCLTATCKVINIRNGHVCCK